MSKSALPGWAPPEVLEGLPYNEKSDVFNCGMLYWQVCDDVARDAVALSGVRSRAAQMVTRDVTIFKTIALHEVLKGTTQSGLVIPEDTPEEFVVLVRRAAGRCRAA